MMGQAQSPDKMIPTFPSPPAPPDTKEAVVMIGTEDYRKAGQQNMQRALIVTAISPSHNIISIFQIKVLVLLEILKVAL